METNASWSAIQGHWDDYKGRIKQKWRKLTDDDLRQIEGYRERLIGTLQNRYGEAKDKVEQQVDDFVASASTWLQEAKDKMAEVAERGKEYWDEHSVDDMVGDLRCMISRYPLRSALVGIGLGYLVGRIFGGSHRS